MDREKHIDESWKETATRDKESLDRLADSNRKQSGQSGVANSSSQARSSESPAGGDALFLNYISSLIYQVAIFLGEMPHPATHQIEQNLDQAKLLIDTLIMLREKTKGNLTAQEGDFLNASIYDLQMKYLEVSEKKPNA